MELSKLISKKEQLRLTLASATECIMYNDISRHNYGCEGTCSGNCFGSCLGTGESGCDGCCGCRTDTCAGNCYGNCIEQCDGGAGY